MPVTAPMPGPPPVAPAIPVTGQVMPPGLAAAIAATGDPVDLVSLSPAALLQQVLDAPGVAMQQLGSLLREVEQITQLTSRAAPLPLGELAAEIGAAAGELEAGVQALLPSPDERQTPLQLATATLRALGTLAPALRQTAAEGADPAPAHRPDAPPALPGIGDLSGERSVGVPAPGYDTVFTGPTQDGNPPADGAGPDQEVPSIDPGREAQAAARVILRSAADTLGRMQLGLDAAAAPATAAIPAAAAPGPEYDAAWCVAQIALAQAQVARASRAIERQPRAEPRWRRMAALLDQHGIGVAGTSGRQRKLARVGASLLLLCIATAALWAASRLDLTLARVAAAILLALAGLAWTWRRRASWRQPRWRIELRR